MVSSLRVDCNVDVYYISILYLAEIWYAVADDFIHRRANGFGKIVIVERTGIHVPLDAGLVNDAIDLIRRHANAQGFSGDVQHLPSHGAGMTEPVLGIELFRAVHADGIVGCPVPLLRHGDALQVVGIVRAANRRGHHPTRTEHRRPERSGEVIRLSPRREGLLDILWCVEGTRHSIGRGFAMSPTGTLGCKDLLRKLVNALMRFPIGLEAFLAAEIGRGHPELDAGWTCQGLLGNLGTAGRGAFTGRHG